MTAMAETVTGTKRPRLGVNWTLALLTIPGAAAVVGFLYMQILGTAGCTDQSCPRRGPGEFGFTLIQFGAPAVAVAAIVISVFTARRKWGLLVPGIAWVLLIVAAVVTAVSFS
jgi:hypothetical protein